MDNELKPVHCNCGGEAEAIVLEDYETNEPWHIVQCNKCKIETDEYRTKAEAITAWNQAMGAKDINVPNKGFWKPIYASEATGFDPSLAGCDPVFNHVCSACGQETLINDFGEEYLSDFCPHCGADMREEYEDIPMEYFENGGI